MVGLSEATRDLDVVHAGLVQWFRHRRGASAAIDVSPFGVNTVVGLLQREPAVRAGDDR